jgi:predicted DNA-binding transcriptional regulator YafY
MKGERKAQLELLLKSHPEGMRRAEIARKLGVNRSTITRYIDELTESGIAIELNSLIMLKNQEIAKPEELSVYESLALNLSAEAMASKMDLQNPYLASGIKKIASNMRSYAPKISQNMLDLAEEIEARILNQQTRSEQINSILEALIDAWVSGRIVRITHIIKTGEIEETELAPYFIGYVEAESGRNPITVTGRLRHTSEVTTINISAIKTAVILEETYTIPDNMKAFRKAMEPGAFDPTDIVPLEIKIREKSAINSLRTLMHSQLELSRNAKGEQICKVEIENSIELVLRLIQCGPSIEVLGPEKFRSKFIKYLRDIIQVYNQ